MNPPTGPLAADDADQPVGRRPSALTWAAIMVAVLVVWVGGAAAMALDARSHLAAAESTLPAAREAVADADLPAASAAVEAARDDLVAARSRLTSPVVAPFRVVPIVGEDLRAVTALAEGGAGVAESGADVIAAIEALPQGLASLAPAAGRLPVDQIAVLAAPLRSTADATASAVEAVLEAPGSGRVAQITDGRSRVLELLEPLAAQAETGARLTAQLPTFLGADGPRTYLLGASTPAEARNTGGFIGSVTEVRFDDGMPEFGEFIATSDLPLLPADELPPPEGSDDPVWSRYGGTGSWQNLARTPHFPTAAAAMEELWAATGGEDVDGMLVVDPFALEALLEFAGPADVPGGVTLDAGSVVDYVTNEAYEQFDSEDERKAVLGSVAAATLEGFLDVGADLEEPGRLVEALGGLASAGHLRVHATDPDVQAAFAGTALAGELPEPDGDLVSVSTYSGTASKVDYYAERTVEHEVTLLEGGGSRSEMTVMVANDAPTSGPPSYVIGPNAPSLDAGDNLFEVSVHLARGARFGSTPAQTDAGPSVTETERDHPVDRGWTRVASGGSTERTYAWTTPAAWSTEGDELRYELVFVGQTTIRPSTVSLVVRVPEGLEPRALPPGASFDGEAVRWEGEIRGERVSLPLRLQLADR